mmetsp:Transcript_31289/g.91644  ORF Transcript_31289/g.91644 Transcript_31289/m.91644 type:complete len:258 (-) Transcript_31289:4-777(-)
MLRQQTLGKFSAIGLDLGEQRCVCFFSLTLLHIHSSEGCPSTIIVVDGLDTKTGNVLVSNSRNLHVPAIVGQGQHLARRNSFRAHHTRPHERIAYVLTLSKQLLALIIPGLGHATEHVYDDRKEAEWRFPFPGDPHDALASFTLDARGNKILHTNIIDRTGVTGIGLGIERRTKRLEAGWACSVQCQDGSAILHQRLKAGLIVDVAEHQVDIRQSSKIGSHLRPSGVLGDRWHNGPVGNVHGLSDKCLDGNVGLVEL